MIGQPPVAPGKELAVCAPGRGFPFLFRGQPFARPGGKGHGVVMADLHHRVVVFALQAAARPGRMAPVCPAHMAGKGAPGQAEDLPAGFRVYPVGAAAFENNAVARFLRIGGVACFPDKHVEQVVGHRRLAEVEILEHGLAQGLFQSFGAGAAHQIAACRNLDEFRHETLQDLIDKLLLGFPEQLPLIHRFFRLDVF